MANSKISALTSATTPLAGTETLPVVQSSTTKQVSVANLTVGRSVSTGDLYSVKTSAGAVVDVATIQNLDSSANTEAALFFAPTTATGNIRGARISGINDGGNVVGLKFYTGSAGTITSKLEIEGATTGNVTLKTGNLIQGTAAKGINFTANSAAAGKTSQLLNWYEEGTWTPTISGDTTSGTQTYTWQYGAYTRIGRQVTCTASVRIATTSGMAGSLVIGGLPFTSRSGDRIAGSVHLAIWGNLTAGQVYIAGYVSPSSTTATLTGSTGATGNLTGLAVSTFAAGSYIDAVITYMT